MTAQDHYQRALRLSSLGDKIAAYSEAIRFDPAFAPAYARRGGARLASGDTDGCIADCSAALQIDSELLDAYYNRGLAYSRSGQHAQAVADYTAAIRLRQADGANGQAAGPNAARLYVNRGAAYAGLKDFDAAIADYTAALALDPTLSEAYFNRSLAHSQRDNFEAAISDYSASIRLNLGDTPHRGKAQADPAATAAYLERLLREWPDHPQAALIREEIARLTAR